MAKKKNLPCASCGELLWRSTTSLPEGQATCRPCRNSARTAWVPQEKPWRRNTCADCGASCTKQKRRCWPCYVTSVQSQADPKAAAQRRRDHDARRRRDRAAPGLTRSGRDHLLAKWKRQGRACAYCTAQAESVDHVIPLALGGTHYEGNLVPCCMDCNVRKSDMLLVEWWNRRRLKRERPPLPPRRPVKPKKKKVWVELALATCPICSGLHAERGKCCSKDCRTELERRQMRDLYRSRHGIPVDPAEPTSVWIRQLRAA